MLVPISEIMVNPGRREVSPGDVKELADSILEVGLINPIMVDQAHTLIAGLHRLEAMKLLGRTEIECAVSDLDGLQVELAEIDENFVRKDLSDDEFRELLLRRKEIYESLHPETKHGGDRKSEKIKSAKCTFDSAKSFVDDTAEKLGVDPSTVRRELQTAKNLTPATLEPAEPEAPAEAPPPSVPYSSSGRHFATIEESIADLKNPDKDCSYTPDSLLAELDSFIQKFHREFEWYSDPFCTVVFPDISQVQFDYIQKRFGTISTAIHGLLQQMKC